MLFQDNSLLLATYSGCFEAVKYLAENGAELNAKNSGGVNFSKKIEKKYFFQIFSNCFSNMSVCENGKSKNTKDLKTLSNYFFLIL